MKARICCTTKGKWFLMNLIFLYQKELGALKVGAFELRTCFVP